MVALHDSGDRDPDAAELDEPGGGALGLEWEELDGGGRLDAALDEDAIDGLLREVGRRVEEVDDLRGRLYPVLVGHRRIEEPVVLAASEVFEAGRLVRQNVGIGDVREKSLLGESQLKLAVLADGDVVKVLQTALHGYAVAHLYHGAALLRLEELDLGHVAVQAEEVEELVAVDLVRLEAVDHHDRTLSRGGRTLPESGHVAGPRWCRVQGLAARELRCGLETVTFNVRLSVGCGPVEAVLVPVVGSCTSAELHTSCGYR